MAHLDLSDRKQKNKIILLLFAFTFLVYGNCIKNSYAIDDNYVTVTTPEKPNNHRIEKGIKGIPKLFSSHYMESKQQTFEYRPLVLATFAIEYQLFGSNPHISHFFNVLFYALTICVLFLLLTKILNNYNPLLPLLITALFMAHPIHTEVVANIKSRDELLSFLFGISAMLFILKYIELKSIRYVVFALLFLLMGLLCKRTAILFLGFIPLTLYFFSPIKLKQLLLLCLIPLVSMICFHLVKRSLLSESAVLRPYAFFENPLFYEDGFFARLPLAFYSIGYYVKLLLFPYPLNCYYGYSTIPFAQWGTPMVILSLVFYTAITIYALRNALKKSMLSFSILVYLAGIFPFSNLLSNAAGIVAERYIYFASLGFCMALGYGLMQLFKTGTEYNPKAKTQSLSPLFMLSGGFLLILYSCLTISRNKNWKDEITLFRNDLKNFKNSCNLNYITGNKLYPQIFTTPDGPKKDSIINETKLYYQQALNLMKEGVKKYPADYTTQNNIGTIYVNIFNDPVSAHSYFKHALLTKPDNTEALYNDAFCYERKNKKDSAILAYEKLIATDSTYLPAYVQLRELYLATQKYPAAIVCDKKLIDANPGEARLYINLGNSYINNKDTASAVKQFEQAVAIEPGNTSLRNQIVTFLRSAGYAKEAEKLEKQ
jgi:tetratricopeptide (TPR) repeat protein